MNTEALLLYNKGTEYVNKNNFKKALPLLKKSYSLLESREALVNMGNCYRAMGNDSKMMDCYVRAVKEGLLEINTEGRPSITHALNNLGLAYYTLGDDARAIECYTRAVKIFPEFWEAWWNCSTATLRQASSGRVELFPKGWEMYRARFLKTPPVKLKNDREDLVYWDWLSGQKADSIVVLTEQGIGDNLMWGRYLQLLETRFSRVYVQCDPSLDPIFSEYTCVRHTSECSAAVAYPMCSLAECFGVIPPGDWLRGRFGAREFSEGPNIGIVWSGSPSHANNHNRSVSINRFHGLAKYANLYGLGLGFEGNKYVRSLDLNGWEDTCAAINGLDLVIGVDTSVIHMAGCLGGEVWMLQPLKETDFRWGNGVSRSVWYDNVEIFSNPNSWEFVFSQVETALKDRYAQS